MNPGPGGTTRAAVRSRYGIAMLAVAVLALPLIVAACGSGGSRGGGASTSMPTSAPTTTAAAGGSASTPTSTPTGTGNAGIGATATPTTSSAAATPTATPAAAASASAQPGTVEVKIVDFKFEPAMLTIPKGTTVIWTNVGPTAHTTTSKQGVWDSGIMEKGATYRFTFDSAGTFDYWCALHPDMLGSITVQ